MQSAKDKIRYLFRALLSAVFIALAACSTTPEGRGDLLDFISDGSTRKQEVHTRLGAPSAQYESSRILAYRIGKGASGYYVSAPAKGWLGVQYSLIMVFDDDGVLRRHSLVEVRTP